MISGKIHFFVIVILAIACFCAAGVYNFTFETFDPNAPKDANVSRGDPFIKPQGWDYKYNSRITSELIPETSSDVNDWKIDPEVGLKPFEGENFLVVSTGGYFPDAGTLSKIYARQKITVLPGQAISGAYFFGTTDYYHWSDEGQIALIPHDPDMNEILILEISVDDVGDHSSTNGWQRFNYVIGPDQGGIYDLEIAVWDVDDSQLDTYLAVDNILVCDSNVGQGDINMDCRVNMADLRMVLKDWMFDCGSDVYPGDPNHYCFQGSDINQDGLVDSNDLDIVKQTLYTGNAHTECYIQIDQNQGDLNGDCRVNLEDVAMIAADWIQDCSDQAYYDSPYSNCRYGTNIIDTDGWVNTEDLKVIMDNWLLGTEPITQ